MKWTDNNLDFSKIGDSDAVIIYLRRLLQHREERIELLRRDVKFLEDAWLGGTNDSKKN
jgi:hypothetical protein